MSAYDGRVVQRSRDRDGPADLSGNAGGEQGEGAALTGQEAQRQALEEHHALQAAAERRREAPRQREDEAAAERAAAQALTVEGARAEARAWLEEALQDALPFLSRRYERAQGRGLPRTVGALLAEARATLGAEEEAHARWVERRQRRRYAHASRFRGPQILGAGPPGDDPGDAADDPEPYVAPRLGAGWWATILALTVPAGMLRGMDALAASGKGLEARLDALEAKEGQQAEEAPAVGAEQIARLASVVGRLEARLAGLEARLTAQDSRAAQGQDDGQASIIDERRDHAAEEGAR